MEFFTYPWMELFFGENTEKYKYAHFVSALTCIPYMACVDEFQHKVFENIGMTAKERREVWHQLERIICRGGIMTATAFSKRAVSGCRSSISSYVRFIILIMRWRRLGVLEFYGRMKTDRKTAWEDYFRLCCAGGSKGYFDLLKLAHLSNPFEDGTVKGIMDSLKDEL